MSDMTLNEAHEAQTAARAAATAADATVRELWARAAVSDPGHPLYEDPAAPHWHVRRHREDDYTAAFATVFAALAYAGEELDRVTDHEADGITGAGEVGDYEAAYRAYERVQSWANLAENATRLHGHASVPPWLRPPLYAGPDEVANVAALRVAATHHVTRVNSDGPDGFEIWECPIAECAPRDDE